MDTDIINHIVDIINNIIIQLKESNTIDEHDLKSLCYIEYQQKTIINNEAIENALIKAFSLIKENTKILHNQKIKVENLDDIFNCYINNSLKQLYGEL